MPAGRQPLLVALRVLASAAVVALGVGLMAGRTPSWAPPVVFGVVLLDVLAQAVVRARVHGVPSLARLGSTGPRRRDQRRPPSD